MFVNSSVYPTVFIGKFLQSKIQ